MQRHALSQPALALAVSLGSSLSADRTLAAGSCTSEWSDEFPAGWVDNQIREIKVTDADGVPGPEVYVGGLLDLAGGYAVNGIARWDGQSWQALGEGIATQGFAGLGYAIEGFDDGSGRGSDLYAAGFFDLRRWDGREWSAVPDFHGPVHDLLAYDDGRGLALFVAGNFDLAGEVAAPNIARWDGRRWSQVGGGMDGTVYALLPFDDGTGSKLYAAGNFDMAGDVPAVGIARWDGNSWSSVGALTDAFLRALVVHDEGDGPALYVGGSMSFDPGAPMKSRVAAWTGAAWEQIGADFSSTVRSLASFDDGGGIGAKLFAGGSFLSIGGAPVDRLASWSGETWVPIDLNLDSSVHRLAVVSDPTTDRARLWIGGDFHGEPPMESDFLTVWDGERTVPLGSGASSLQFGSPFEYGEIGPTVVDLLAVEAPSVLAPGLYATGDFANAGGTLVNSVARWDGHAWSALGDGLNNFGEDLKRFDDGAGEGPVLFVGGEFNTDGPGKSDPLARWNGSQWSFPAAPVHGSAHSLTTLVNDRIAARPLLMLGGDLEMTATGQQVSVSAWDGTNWFAIGEEFNGPVHALHVFDDGLGDGPVLFAGGNFSAVGGMPASRIARWDGKQWSALAGGVDSIVRAISSFDDGDGAELYVGGQFDHADGILTGSVARWNGQQWSPVIGDGQPIPSYGIPNGHVWSLHVHDDGRGPALFVGGIFVTVAGVPARHVARWDGSEWTSLAAGISLPDAGWNYGLVLALASFDDDADGEASLFVGGHFSLAGGKSSGSIARWSSCGPGPSAADLDGDGFVGPLDLALLLSEWGPCGGGACAADLTGDHDVDGFDLAYLLSQWGN